MLFLQHLVSSQIQINFQHNCLYIRIPFLKKYDERQILSFCLTESTLKFEMKINHIDPIYTFDQLAEKNITAEELYQWSASIDLIEQYQLYLNDQTSLLGNQTFYNCTLPYFGPECQYVFKDLNYSQVSLMEMIREYYYSNEYEPMLFTCYEHLQCNRGPSPACLDWTEICDGKIDCLDEGLDEKDCWKLEIVGRCDKNQFQCHNGQCIPDIFKTENKFSLDCIDQSDETSVNHNGIHETNSVFQGPIIALEDVSCAKLNTIERSYFHPWASSCVKNRQRLFFDALFSMKHKSLSDECWTVYKCIVHIPISKSFICKLICQNGFCEQILKTQCPQLIYVSAVPILFGHVNMVIDKNELLLSVDGGYRPFIKYICFDRQRLYVNDSYRYMNFSSWNNQTCFTRTYLTFNIFPFGYWPEQYLAALHLWFDQNSIIIENNLSIYTNSNLYECKNWPKVIPNRRLKDSFTDCCDNDDEIDYFVSNNCFTGNSTYHFLCSNSSCITASSVNDDYCDCPLDSTNQICVDENRPDFDRKHSLLFQKLCNNIRHIFNDHNGPVIIPTEDETNCEYWPLVHIYNHCDGYFDNENGLDELNCDPSPPIICPSNHHLCISEQTHQFICLSINKTNDGIIDCVGAFDESRYCHKKDAYGLDIDSILCQGNCISAHTLCDSQSLCIRNNSNEVCQLNYQSNCSEITQFICKQYLNIRAVPLEKYFTLDQRMSFADEQTKDEEDIYNIYAKVRHFQLQSYHRHCHRGLELNVYLDKSTNLITSLCLCPPSYYGSHCQYQNQRVSLTVQFRASSDSIQIPFLIIISLIDNSEERIIHSSEQFIYLSSKHCRRKFHFNFLYSTRPKNSLKEYFLHFDIYEKITFKYRASLIKKIEYQFLPVHRLVYLLDIPFQHDSIESCRDRTCLHGKCIRYANDLVDQSFCQCESGWSGEFCSMKYDCQCSSDAFCLGQLANNQSICICPLHRKGPKCLIEDKICVNQTCSNRGQCLSLDEYEKKFVCICEKDYSSDEFCQNNQTKIILSFNENIRLPTIIFIHFIEIKFQHEPDRTTTVKAIYPGQYLMTIRWSLPFHLVFIQLDNETYYLALMQKIYKPSSVIERNIQSSDQCLHIKDLFNDTFVKIRLINQIKYYHLPCQRMDLNLQCFYDDIQLCLCQQVANSRVANCFDFNHKKSSICKGINGCKNGGLCYQEENSCSRISICQCPVCFYGTQCEVTTNSFNLSLDAILAFAITPNLSLKHQSLTVIMCLCVTIILVCLGLINGCCSLITFKDASTRQSGCGIYLLCSSILTFWILFFFLLKFLIVLLSQIGSIKNYFFLNIQCYSMDFLLRCCLNIDQWLTAFVAIERAIISFKGANFQPQKARFYSKWITICSIFFIILTNIHDPLHRKLFEENSDEQQRYWCIVEYSSTFLHIYNSFITIFHFILPFIINFISALIIIFLKTKQQINVKKIKKQQRSHLKKILFEQIQQHKNLLIAPCVLTILGIPRLIMSFTSSCMTSNKDFWFYFLGYNISLVPSLLTFVIFVLPSSTYKEAFRAAISRFHISCFKR